MSSNIEITKICIACGAEFKAKKTTTKTCSGLCAKRFYKLKKRNEKIEEVTKQTIRTIQKPIEEIKAKEYLSINDFCKLTGISRTTLWRLSKEGKIKYIQLNKRKIYRKSDIEKL